MAEPGLDHAGVNVDTGETRPFPYGDERHGLPRTDDLVFAVLVKQV